MSTDPNGSRWSTSEKNFGKALLKKSGWIEGSGLGRDHDGIATHIKSVRKDDTTGIGYKAGVHETWNTQSVGFADVLDRIKKKTAITMSNSDVDEEDDDVEKNSGGELPASPAGSKHFKMYAKRNALKTELLRTTQNSDESSHREILGHAARHKRSSDTDEKEDRKAGNKRNHPEEMDRAENNEKEMETLRSPLLLRLMERCVKHELNPNAHVEEGRVRIVKPTPRPPKCMDTPFLLK
ncbi:unnamed protein product [Phytomonas sp. Hart1]|nr:unnamed protein product [Phytomonas sp. Hart1]|eukprot:CCW71178.1 unnamed protein product [Phytomonas sp. isolate Hart1]